MILLTVRVFFFGFENAGRENFNMKDEVTEG